jgi:hypothetical protein
VGDAESVGSAAGAFNDHERARRRETGFLPVLGPVFDPQKNKARLAPGFA